MVEQSPSILAEKKPPKKPLTHAAQWNPSFKTTPSIKQKWAEKEDGLLPRVHLHRNICMKGKEKKGWSVCRKSGLS